MNPRLFFMQGKQRALPINTIIGGVASTISTKALLSTKLGISESIIKRFEIVGSDVHAHISSDYDIPNACFQNDTQISKYLDLGNHVKIVNNFGFQNSTINDLKLLAATSVNSASISNTYLENLELNVTSAGSGFCALNNYLKTIQLLQLETITNKPNFFAGLIACELIDMRKLKIYGTSSTGGSATNSGFANLKMGCEIRVNIALRTINAGNVDPALNWVKANRGAIVKFYNDDVTYNSTL